MAGIDMHKRIEALERIYGQEREHNPERERLIEELKARWPAFEEKMAREEAEGNFARRRALEELREQVEQRRRGE
jgi:hypothetical protein